MINNRLIIDVREPDEYERGHVDGAINLPPQELLAGADALKEVSKDTELVLYCKTGARSNASMHILRQLGFKNVINGINQAHVEKRFL